MDVEMVLTQRFRDALVRCFELHCGQGRKGPAQVPYLGHLLGVCSLVIDDGGSEDEAIAALLHDAVEDAGGQATLQGIRGQFGDRVAEIVERCSDTDKSPKPPWRARKESHLEHLGRETDAGVLRVTAADKLQNVRALLDDYRREGDAVWGRFTTASAEDQLWFYRSVADLLLESLPGPLATELDRTVVVLEWYVRCGGIGQAISHNLQWSASNDSAATVGPDGTEWAITPSSSGGFDITVAEWDRPDWRMDTLGDAMLLVAELDGRPPFWRELMVSDWLAPDW